MNIGLRIKKRREELNMTAEELGEKIGKAKTTIYRYESGFIEKLPSSVLDPIADALNTTPSYLMGWTDNESPSYVSMYNHKGILPIPKMKRIPLLGDIACGTPILAEQNIECDVSCPDDLGADFCLRCHGDSMIGARIMDGDIVYIRQQPEVNNGQIAAVLIGDDATLKRVYRYPGKLVLQPENPAFEPLIYIKEEIEQVKILGLAVAFTSRVV